MRSYRDEHPQRRQTPPDARISIKIAKGLSAGDVKRILAEAQRARLYTLRPGATLGFRRGELLGLRCSDLDLNLGIDASAPDRPA
jgi:integrase